MLIIRIHNDGTGEGELCNYDIEVLVTTSPTTLRTIETMRVEGHKRGDGYKAILRRMIDQPEITASSIALDAIKNL